MLKKIFNWSLLDNYIFKKYISSFLFTFILLSVIAVVFDVSERLEKFISQDCTVRQIIFEYYLNFIPWINSLLFPLYALISVIFFTSKLAEKTEIIPMLSAGIPYSRFLKPYVVAGSLFTIVHLIANHFFIPSGNQTLKAFENKYIKTTNIKTNDRNVHLFISPNVKVFVKYYRASDSTCIGFQMEKYDQGKLVEMLSTEELHFDSLSNFWKADDYTLRQFSDSIETFSEYKNVQLDTSLNLKHSDFAFIVNQKETMTTPELWSFIKRERQKGSGITRLYEVEQHRRSADPVTTLILSIIGASIASRKVRGGMGLYLAAGVILGAVYIFLSKLSLTFANNEILSPLVAVWIPNILFGTISYWLYKKAQK